MISLSIDRPRLEANLGLWFASNCHITYENRMIDKRFRKWIGTRNFLKKKLHAISVWLGESEQTQKHMRMEMLQSWMINNIDTFFDAHRRQIRPNRQSWLVITERMPASCLLPCSMMITSSRGRRMKTRASKRRGQNVLGGEEVGFSSTVDSWHECLTIAHLLG